MRTCCSWIALTKIGIKFWVANPIVELRSLSSALFTIDFANDSVDKALSTSWAIKPTSSYSLKLFSVSVIKLKVTGFNLFTIINPLFKGVIFSLNFSSDVAIVAFVANICPFTCQWTTNSF
jgi:uncharacterized membrane protein